MMGGTKGGAQSASSFRPRCVGEVDCETATHIYLSNLLEPSGPVQTCNGIALPFAFRLPSSSEMDHEVEGDIFI
jgi:hypothetical protein